MACHARSEAGEADHIAELRRSSRTTGFVSKDVSVVARGMSAADHKTFNVSGTNQLLAVSEPPRKTGENLRAEDPRTGEAGRLR
jgi:hypothetical protein